MSQLQGRKNLSRAGVGGRGHCGDDVAIAFRFQTEPRPRHDLRHVLECVHLECIVVDGRRRVHPQTLFGRSGRPQCVVEFVSKGAKLSLIAGHEGLYGPHGEYFREVGPDRGVCR
jgi:hypothetical protein